MEFKSILSVTLILFAVIDILGSIPILVNIREQSGKIRSEAATLVAGSIMIIFLYTGESLLGLIGIDIASFALAGAVVMAIIALEMILGINIFKEDPDPKVASIVPIAFPLIAGAGTLTTLISLRVEFDITEILVGILINLVLVYLVLRSIPLISRILGSGGLSVLRRIFGIILLAIAIKIFKTYIQ